MAITVSGSPTLTATKVGTTKPGLTDMGINAVGSPLVAWHLTTGFNATDPTKSSASWTATGSVGVDVPAADQPLLAKWNFGFMQYMKLTTFTCTYAGRRPQDGGILIDAAKSPA